MINAISIAFWQSSKMVTAESSAVMDEPHDRSVGIARLELVALLRAKMDKSVIASRNRRWKCIVLARCPLVFWQHF